MSDLIGDAMQQILEQLKSEVQTNMSVFDINASGRTSASLRVKKTAQGWALVGGNSDKVRIPPDIDTSATAPLQTLETGRPAGGVPRGFYYIIRQWSRDKGINFSQEKKRDTFAYFVSKKIKERGTLRYQANVDIYTTPRSRAKEEAKKTARNYVVTAVSSVKGVGK